MIKKGLLQIINIDLICLIYELGVSKVLCGQILALMSLEAADVCQTQFHMSGLMLCASWFQPAGVTSLVLLDRDAVRWAGYVNVSPA